MQIVVAATPPTPGSAHIQSEATNSSPQFALCGTFVQLDNSGHLQELAKQGRAFLQVMNSIRYRLKFKSVA
jgi:hypothetical protein